MTLRAVNTEKAPAPPYPPDVQANGWRLELDIVRAQQSDTWVLAADDVRPWLLMLWATAWMQTPCGSLPSDDLMIARHLRMEPRQFHANREQLMRGWWLASDGRLYHPYLTTLVERMRDGRTRERTRKQALRSGQTEWIKERDGHKCIYCGSQKRLTVEHMLARAVGGTDDDDNLACACHSCNSKKQHRTMEEAGMTILDAGAKARFQAYMAGRSADLSDRTPNGRRSESGSVPPLDQEQEQEVVPLRGTTNTGAAAPPPARARVRVAAPVPELGLEPLEPPPVPAVKTSDLNLLVAAGVPRDLAGDWLSVRRAKRLPLTKTALEAVVREAAAAGLTLEAALRMAAERGWGSFRAAWLAQDRTATSLAPQAGEPALGRAGLMTWRAGQAVLQRLEAAEAAAQGGLLDGPKH